MNNLSILTPEVLTISGVLAISLVAFIISLSGKDSLVFENASADQAEMHNMCDELDTSSERYIVIIPSRELPQTIKVCGFR